MDRAAMIYIKQVTEERGWTRGQLAKYADIPYQSLRGLWDNDRAVSVGDLKRLLAGLRVDSAKGFKDIERIASTLEDSDEQ